MHAASAVSLAHNIDGAWISRIDQLEKPNGRAPAVGAGHGIDELRRDADAVASSPDTSLHDVAPAQLLRGLPDIDRLALVLEA
jgi:hypothetical protein